MRQHKRAAAENTFSILTLDDDPIMTSAIQAYFQRAGYQVDAENDPSAAIERVRNGSYDILLLDYLMTPLCGDQVVEQIRRFNKELFIVLLTGHKDMVPPVKTIRMLDIQGYFEKSDRFDQLELLVESCVKAIRQTRTIRGYRDGLSRIVESTPDLYDLNSSDHVTDSIIRTVSSLLPCQSILLMLKKNWDCEEGGNASSGFISRAMGEGAAVPDGQTAAQLLAELDGRGSVVRAQQVNLPLSDSVGDSFGFLSIGLKAAPEDNQIQMLEVFARQASDALENRRLHSLLQESNHQLSEAYDSLQASYLETISTLRLVVDAKDAYTRGHSDRVSFYAHQIAIGMGRSPEYCERVRIAGLFHDVGKLSVPDEILLKPAKLTDSEYEVIKTHPRSGIQLLAAITKLKPILPAVLSHHERLDGRGYPEGLKGNAIPEEARIIAVADSFDAMTSNRQYRRALPVSYALEEFERLRGVQYDPEVVDVFIGLVKNHGLLDRMHEQLGFDAAVSADETK